MYDYATTSATHLCIGKWANTSVIGVVAADTAADSLAPVHQNAGAYTVNAIAGSPSKAFDMSTAQLRGNSGTVLNYAVVLDGM
jgi:hypothetical protein